MNKEVYPADYFAIDNEWMPIRWMAWESLALVRFCLYLKYKNTPQRMQALPKHISITQPEFAFNIFKYSPRFVVHTVEITQIFLLSESINLYDRHSSRIGTPNTLDY